ncbi:YiiX/YebB-like N1pC/P60 family cysteine hydrolase [Bradyrhizobium japonicum]|uniref:YiiX/YebB-like N1pC/P60 family cysteine hydrolase n=1 Tax=Bradyrhizobium japonicum TaxID=375 RepID=UPI001BAAF967|nr:YiiX/YebB-like N1pC/P60 family cysteine hydrolase [Bradyrhizobium japonicum]MBR0910629.1 hypothetical protein [Bradyrhizobium japonicum]
MKKLNDQRLQVGDIILTSGPNKVSKAVRRATGSDISHAMIYVQHSSIIDATADGVHSSNIQRMFFEEGSAVYVLRSKLPLGEETIRKITDFARAATGTEYSKSEAVAVLAKRMRRAGSRKQFCSRLAAQAYAAGGVSLVPEPDYCSPEDLRRSERLMEVEDVLLPASDEEIALWGSRTNVLKMMADATNAVLKTARRRSDQIHNLNDINSYLLAHPEDDQRILRAYEKSGYLTLWQVEYAKSRWQYDLDSMRHLANVSPNGKTEMEEYCRQLLSDSEGGLRFEINHREYGKLALVTKLSTFQALAKLYQLLAALHHQRVETARNWLAEANNGVAS